MKLFHRFTGPLEEWGQQEVPQAFAVLDFLWTLQLQPSSLDSRHCRDTPALRFFSYLLPLGLSVSPCTWPRLVMVVEEVVMSPAGGSRVGEERHPDSVSHPTLSTPTCQLKRQSPAETQRGVVSRQLRQQLPTILSAGRRQLSRPTGNDVTQERRRGRDKAAGDGTAAAGTRLLPAAATTTLTATRLEDIHSLPRGA